jgi:Tfp pilus assembly protein PilF
MSQLPNRELINLVQTQKWKPAIRALESNKRTYEDRELLWNLGWAYYKVGHLQRARTRFRKCVELGPEWHVAHLALGVVLLKTDQLSEARASLRRSLAIQDSFLARQALALVYMKLRNYAKAERIWLEGLALKPESAKMWHSYGGFLEDSHRMKEAKQAYSRARTLKKGSSSKDNA